MSHFLSEYRRAASIIVGRNIVEDKFQTEEGLYPDYKSRNGYIYIWI